MSGRCRRAAPDAPGAVPQRTCIGCRRVRPQGEMLRLVRGRDGFVEPDERRRRGGRGVYLCRSASCLHEAIRRGRFSHAFRARAVLRPETDERLRASIEVGLGSELADQSGGDEVRPAARGNGRARASVEGGW